MDIDVKQLIRDELDSDEELLWDGRPKAKVATGSNAVLFLFGVIFMAFSLFWTMTLLENNARSVFRASVMDKIFPFFSIPFMAAGVGLLFSPLWNYRKTENTVYGITSKRCMIIVNGRTRKVQSYDHAKIGNIEKVQYSNGYGDILFAKEQYTTSDDSHGTEVRMRSVGFLNIPDVSEAERQLKAAVRCEIQGRKNYE